jgi:hypothetical protein
MLYYAPIMEMVIVAKNGDEMKSNLVICQEENEKDFLEKG